MPDGASVPFEIPVPRRTQGSTIDHGRWLPGGLDPDLNAESLAVSADGKFLTVAMQEQRFDLMLAENVSGLKRRAAP